jgi:hypothetical protein
MVPWFFVTALRAVVVGLVLAANGVVATPGFKSSASPGHNSLDVCLSDALFPEQTLGIGLSIPTSRRSRNAKRPCSTTSLCTIQLITKIRITKFMLVPYLAPISL